MKITYNLPHVFAPDSDSDENAFVLRTSLDYITALNVGYLRRRIGKVPKLYNSGVTYGRTRLWEPIPALYARGVGDCKSLSTALLAEYKIAGLYATPEFRWIVRPDGYIDFHILINGPNGREDPSRLLGMGDNENSRTFYDNGE
jgi:hypothetical protein